MTGMIRKGDGVMKYEGSCLCGAIIFKIEGEFENFYLCHCERCRKDTGSAHAANLFSSTAQLTWLSGQDKARTYDFNSTGHIKSFCSICGSALPNIQMDGALVVVPAGSLDTDVPIRPQGHIFIANKANWDSDLDDVPRFDRLPPEKQS
jgi:Uncharacterized conserved protein